MLDHYPDEFNKFQLALDGDDFVKEENIDLGLTVAERRVVELEKVRFKNLGCNVCNLSQIIVSGF